MIPNSVFTLCGRYIRDRVCSNRYCHDSLFH